MSWLMSCNGAGDCDAWVKELPSEAGRSLTVLPETPTGMGRVRQGFALQGLPPEPERPRSRQSPIKSTET